jgi:6-pyruvoyltetrahydropterin/6-carboxytetrahydropterin synthase
MAWTATVRGHFDAAHYLPGYNGPCGNMHGHRWEVVVGLKAATLHNGMVLDFRDIKGVLKRLLESLDHRILNEQEFMQGNSPTAEILAALLYNEIATEMAAYSELHPNTPALAFVEVWESPDCCIRYKP